MGNICAIVGRPNVGKSTLFNRLIESREAIVDELAGVTRDRHYGKCEWTGIEFSVIDTGGYIIDSDDVFEEEIRKQVLLAIDEADVILFMVDVENGIMEMDEIIADILRRQPKKVFLVSNKVDNNERQLASNEFYSMGFGELYNISAMSGFGTGELLDAVVKALPNKTTEEAPDIPRFAIVGRPNVGKSSFLNALMGEDRNIVTPIAGTTRDSIDIRYTKFGFDFFLVDTAGLRKKAKEMEDVEFYSIMRSVRAIENSDTCFLIIDAERGVEGQDVNIFRLIQRNHKGIVVLVNKWDLVEKDGKTTEQYSKIIKERFAPFNDLPIIFISALEKQRIFKAIEVAVEVNNNRSKKIPTSQLNDKMLEAIKDNPPPALKGKYVKIKFVTQLPMHYPTFAFFCNTPQYIKEPYKRYLENRLREYFDFKGVPIQIFMRQK